MSVAFTHFTGNCPRSVSRDAKYVILSAEHGPVVAVTYNTDDGERWHVTTDEHPDLVRLVNEIKIRAQGAPNGPFYINEYGQVIVPVGPDAVYYLAGEEYDLPLIFEFEGTTLSGEGIDLNGQLLEPGQPWTGPHPGIPYILEPGMADIRYDSNPRPNVTRKVKLSDHVGTGQARSIAERIGRIKGWSGGRFYINEWKEIFAPLNRADHIDYLYIGHLEENDPWFNKWTP